LVRRSRTDDLPRLILPTSRLHAAFLDCPRRFGPGVHEDGFDLGEDTDVESPDGFAAWVHERGDDRDDQIVHDHGRPQRADMRAKQADAGLRVA
jgi:hypothetical protein